MPRLPCSLPRPCLAQSPTRAEVKKETAEANKAGAIPGTGTGPSANVTPPISAKSDVPRAEVKKETAAANKAGAIAGTGTGPNANTTPAISTKSDVPRAEVKKETAAANKAGTIPTTDQRNAKPEEVIRGPA